MPYAQLTDTMHDSEPDNVILVQDGNKEDYLRRVATEANQHVALKGTCLRTSDNSLYPKRKRNSVDDEFPDTRVVKRQTQSTGQSPRALPDQSRNLRLTNDAGGKAVVLGYWRNSTVPNVDHKHAVVGFLDKCDRLRTRVTPYDMSGRHIDGHLLPTGPSARWLTFERIVFADHLIGLDHPQIKEYVRLVAKRTDIGSREVPEPELVQQAVAQAKVVAVHSGIVSTSIARGATLAKDDVPTATPSETRDCDNARAFTAINRKGSSSVAHPAAAQRPVQPTAKAGRASLRSDRAMGTDANQLAPGMTKASLGPPPAQDSESHRSKRGSHHPTLTHPALTQPRGNGTGPAAITNVAGPPRGGATASTEMPGSSSSTAPTALAAPAALPARTTLPPRNATVPFRHHTDSIYSLNNNFRGSNVFASFGTADILSNGSVGYRRKTTGPFIGKYISQGTIINIDGEEYVEYRVLTRPSFF